MIRLGGPVFAAQDDLELLARAHREQGYRAAYCPQADPGDTTRIAEIRRAFAAQDVVIAEVGAWCNMLAPDEQRRRANQENVKRQLTLADEAGALCCVDYLGTLDPGSDYGPHPANLTPETFDLAVETVRSIIDAVKPRRAKFGLEMMQWVLPDSVDAYLDLIKAVDRPAFGVHLDPVNIILTPRMMYDTTSLLRDCFKRLGPWIASCHAKDIVLRGALAMHLDEVPPATGYLDYRTYLSELNRLDNSPPLMLEHLASEEDYRAAAGRLFAIGRELGIEMGNSRD
ncbi:MAG: sugar phosphate isomerase/epimerase [Planctomycetaceae bacterium]|nr:sugar phosphate isomerase/epimerase [Planctomycetaceae bacterium]